MKHMTRTALDGIERAELCQLPEHERPSKPTFMSPFLDKLKIELYYTVKLLIPRPLQIQIRRFMVRWKLPSVRHVWPIHEGAGNRPADWPGWPGGKKFALVITHDVESARGLDRCEKVAGIEKKHGFRSSFNFVVGDYAVPPNLRQSLKRGGFEIGIHGVHHKRNLFFSRRRFEEHASTINRYLKDWKCSGFRAPSMFSNLDWTHDLKIEYDSSTFDIDPFEPQPEGVKTIFPFHVNKDGGGRDGYIELPYTLPQDFTLFILMGEKDIDLWKRKLDWIVEKGGMALVNVHPDYMNFSGDRRRLDQYPPEFYERFLQYINERYRDRFWNPLPREMARFWRKSVPSKKMTEKPKSRICMLVYSFYESDNRVMRYAETLALRGDDVEVIALKKTGVPENEKLRGVNVRRIQERVKDEKNQLVYVYRIVKFMVKSAFILARDHIRNPYDVIHVHNMPDFLVFSAILPKLLGAKLILDIHDMVPELYVTKFNAPRGLPFRVLLLAERASAWFADHVVIANHLWRDKFISRSTSTGKCSVIMNYPDPRIFHPRRKKRASGKFVMIYPGSLNYRQGIDTAIKAFARIGKAYPDTEFHIYGDGNDRVAFQKLAASLGLKDRVLFFGSIPIYDVADKMADADLAIEPKRNDPFAAFAMSTKILEFMTLGIPVIASDTEVHRHYFNESVLRFFEAGNDEQLAVAMEELIKDKRLADKYAAAASEFAKEFSWEAKKNAYLGLLDDLREKNVGLRGDRS